MDKNKENINFFNKIAGWYDTPMFQWFMKNLQTPVYKKISKEENQLILDVGCGTWNLLLELEKNTNNTLYGIDISENMLEKARKKLSESLVSLQSV